MDLAGKPFEAPDQKSRKKDSRPYTNKTVERKDCESNKFSFPLQTGRLKLKKIEKKAIRSKLLELCKTGTKKRSPDVFKFYVVLGGYDMVTDANLTTTCRRKFKAPSLQNKNDKK